MMLRTCLMRSLPASALFAMEFLSYARSPAPTSSSSSLPRRRATSDGSFSERRPAKVARTTLCGLSDPRHLVRMFWMPAASTTARTAPPAMMPVPSGAGLSSTLPAPKRPSVACGSVVPASGTRTSAFFADDDQSAEAQVLAALDDLGDAVDGHDGVLEVELGRVDLLIEIKHVRTPA